MLFLSIGSFHRLQRSMSRSSLTGRRMPPKYLAHLLLLSIYNRVKGGQMKISILLALLLSLFQVSANAEVEEELTDLKSAAELSLELDLEDFDVDSELDQDDLMSFNRPGRRPPRRHRPPNRRPHREIVCVAVDREGYRYRARAYRPHRAERKAMRRCERNSYYPYSCWVRGCRYTRGGFRP